MSALSRMLAEATILRVEHWRTCPECLGRGEHHRPLPVPGGAIAPRTVVARIQCGRCKGKKKLLVGEEVSERGLLRVWEHGRLVGEQRR